VYKSLGRTWSDADIAEILNLRHKCILAGELNAKHLSWNSIVSNTSGEKLLKFFDRNDFEISAPQCQTHYSPGGSGKYHPEEKANAIVDCLENQFTPHDMCDENHEQRVEAKVQALLEAADNNPYKE
jgi:hypothetical protein